MRKRAEKNEDLIGRVASRAEKIFDGFYKHRYLYGFIVIFVCTVLQLSGSSLDMWKFSLRLDSKPGTVLFAPRPIRSDEWMVFTPMQFSQTFNGYGLNTGILRGSETNVFLTYGLPVAWIFQIFRPFQFGYFTGAFLGPELGNSIGLAFFWSARFVMLFLVALDFFMLITGRRKTLSLVGAILTVLAPVVQWWFSTNGVAELFIFGMGLTVATVNYLDRKPWREAAASKYKIELLRKLLDLLVVLICIGGFAMILYPAWQVPFAYVFGVVFISEVIENRAKLKKTNVLPYLAAVLLALISLAIIMLNCKDALLATVNTAYPGKRVSTGGELGLDYFASIAIDPWLSFLPENLIPAGYNYCELAVFYGLFPLGIILAIINACRVKRAGRKLDLMSSLLFIVIAFISLYCFIGLPAGIAKVTLLSFTVSHRAIFAVSVANLILALRAASRFDKLEFKWPRAAAAAAVSALIAGGYILAEYAKFRSVTSPKRLFLVFVLFFIISFSLLLSLLEVKIKAKMARLKHYAACVMAVLVVSVSTLTALSSIKINPVSRGTGVIYESSLMKELRRIDAEDPGTWISEEKNSADFLVMGGLKTLNSINIYPDLSRWRQLDPEGKYEEVYNRYAHIDIDIEQDDSDTAAEKFTLTAPDSFSVRLSASHLKKLGVKYILTDRTYKSSAFEKVSEVGGRTIYRVKVL